MSATVEGLLTLEEFMAREEREDGLHEELLEGELVVSPTAKGRHAGTVRRLRDHLLPLQERGYVVNNDLSCVLRPSSMPQPDLFAVRTERIEQAEKADTWLEGSPELVIEVASPSNRKLAHKAALYLEHGAEQVWIAYPKSRTVSVFTAERTSEARSGESLEFHGVRVAVDTIFP